MVTAFCHQLGWKNMEMLISQFQDRLHFGIHSELLELMKLPSLNGVRARSLFDSGFESITSIASADCNKIENALHKSIPFQSEKEREGDDSEDIRKRNKIKNIWITGCCAMTVKQAAENLINEARKYLEYEIGVSEIKWDKSNYAESDNAQQVKIDNKENNTLQDSSRIHINPLQNSSSETDVCIKMENNDIDLSLPTKNSQHLVTCNSKNSSSNKSILCASKSIKLEDSENPNDANRSSNANNISNAITNIKVERPSSQALNDLTNISSKCNISKKEEIVWDSLNFTEAGIENVTKLRSNIFYSPNISFGDGEDKTNSSSQFKSPISSKLTSVKDISLFSSDGDNSSLFEDSLPLDLIPSKLLDSDEPEVQITEPMKQETNYISINSNTILNAFKSAIFESDGDEDIKLIYDEEGKSSDADVEINATADIEVVNTQEIEAVSVKNNYISPFKRHATKQDCVPQAKKMKKKATNSICLPVMKRLKSQEIVISVAAFNFTGFILREGDILDNLNILEKAHTASIYIDVKKYTVGQNEIIGNNIFKQKTVLEFENELSLEGNKIKSIAFCCEPNVCIVLDLVSLGNNISLVKRKLCDIFKRSVMKWKVLSLQSIFVNLKRFLDVEFSWSCIDVSLLEWLIYSDEKQKNIFYMVSN